MGRVYVYAVMETAVDHALWGSVAGLDGTSLVEVVARGGNGCVMSAHHGEDPRGASRETMLRYLLRHQQVVEHVMREHTVLPVRFGTMLGSAEEAVALLAQTGRELTRALASVRDRVEVEVAATWDLKRVLQEVGREAEVAWAREQAAATGSPTQEDRVRLGQVVKACLDRRRDVYRERMLEFLRPLAFEVATNALVADEMVMNVAFLVERGRQQEFDERVRALDALFDNQIAFRMIGPLPPYSFGTVEIARLDQEQMEEARRELGLSAVFVEAEVRRAYRHLAAREQAQRGIKASGERLAKVRQAAEVLLAWCRGQGRPGDAAGSEVGARLFTVAVRGTGYQEIAAARFGGAVRV